METYFKGLRFQGFRFHWRQKGFRLYLGMREEQGPDWGDEPFVAEKVGEVLATANTEASEAAASSRDLPPWNRMTGTMTGGTSVPRRRSHDPDPGSDCGKPCVNCKKAVKSGKIYSPGLCTCPSSHKGSHRCKYHDQENIETRKNDRERASSMISSRKPSPRRGDWEDDVRDSRDTRSSRRRYH